MTGIRLSKSVLGPEEAEATVRVILSNGYLGMGAEVKAFEEDLAAFLGVSAETIACVSTGTAALHLAVQAIVDAGMEVLVPSLTFVAGFQAISAAGAVPVSCEVIPETVTIDLADARRRITARTKAIMPVHYAGNPGDLDAIYAFAREHELRVIEDAAHAFGCTYKGRRIGSFGDVCCFSFDGIKNITCGEGGAVVARDSTVLSRVRNARLLGVEKDTEQRYAGGRSWDFDVSRQGYRYHMSNLYAAIGRVQLRRLASEFAPKRVELARRYYNRLQSAAGVALFQIDFGSIIPHILPVRILNGRRDAVQHRLEEEAIEVGIHYKPNHLLTFYGGGRASLPITELLYGELLTLPLHPQLTEADVDKICNGVCRALEAEGV